jgi:hypothetical protein
VSNLLYLLLALAFSVVGSLILWYRHRKPRTMEAGIDEFSRELRALAPEQRGSEKPRG